MSGSSGFAPLPPGSTIGILGGGQLGRMLALAAAPMGLHVHVFCPDAASPAFDVAGRATVASYDDQAALGRFAAAVDAVTFEFENVPGATAAFLADRKPVRPGARALEVAQDRLVEKAFLADLGIPVAPHRAIDSPSDLAAAIAALATPAFLKTRRFGYDGKGQFVVNGPDDVDEAWEAVGGAPSVLESHIAFEREVSVVAARGGDGRMSAYDVSENRHDNQILATASVPARIDKGTAALAIDAARRVLEALDYVGVLAIEFFVTRRDGVEVLIANEIAPRVHNSGHWTADACHAGQFEQHMRAVAGWPLGSSERHWDARMINLIGDDVAGWREAAGESDTRVHLYGKREIRPGRKMGHLTHLSPLT